MENLTVDKTGNLARSSTKNTKMLMPRPKIAFAWKDRGRRLLVMQKIDEAETGFPSTAVVQATPACIIPAGRTAPLKICTSGWRSSTGPAGTLDGERWTVCILDSGVAMPFDEEDKINNLLGSRPTILRHGWFPSPLDHPRYSQSIATRPRERRPLPCVPCREKGMLPSA